MVYRERFYLFAERGEAAAWVKNVRQNPEVVVRIGERQIGATARVLDREADRELWDRVAAIAEQMHLSVLRYRDLHVGNAETSGAPVPRFAAMAAATPVAEPGEGKIRVTIQGELLLVPPRP